LELFPQCVILELFPQCGILELFPQCGVLEVFPQCGILEVFPQCGILKLFTQCGIFCFSFYYKKSLKIPKGGNQNPYIEEEQTTQWPKEEVQKDKQRSTKHTHKTND
jgi:hypothetical protein